MKKKIQLLALLLVACVTLSSCVVGEALKNFVDFHENFQPNQNYNESESTDSKEDFTTEDATDEQLSEREKFETLLDERFVKYLEQDAFSAHLTLEYPERYNIVFDEEDYVLANYEEIDSEAEWEEYQSYIAKLNKIDKNLLTKQQQMLYDKIMYEWEFDNKYSNVIDYTSYIGGDNGIVFSLACNFYEYTFGGSDSISEYFKFLKDIPNYIDYAIKETELQILDGMVPSKYMLKTNMEAIETLCFGESNLFIEGFEEKIGKITFEKDQHVYWLEDNKKIVEEEINPAFQKLYDTMQEWYEKEEDYKGLPSLEGGKEYYEYLAQYYTGTDMTVNEMYRYLLQKLTTYENAFASVMQSNKKLYDKLVDGNYGFKLTNPDDILKSLVEYVNKSYPTIQDPGYTISWLPSSLENQGLLGYYVTPQIDVSDTNVIRLNKANLDKDLAQLYTTLAHEGYPGHLYAINYIQQQQWHPMNETFKYLGYTEGWAEFASYRSLHYWDEISSDMAEALIYNEVMGYILQAITDIGINYRGWSLEDMYDVWSGYYDLENKEELQSVYDFFVAEPASILSYPIGYLQIVDIRNFSKNILSKDFSDTEFAAAFLNIGGAPFPLVEDYMLDWANERFDEIRGIVRDEAGNIIKENK